MYFLDQQAHLIRQNDQHLEQHTFLSLVAYQFSNLSNIHLLTDDEILLFRLHQQQPIVTRLLVGGCSVIGLSSVRFGSIHLSGSRSGPALGEPALNS